MTIKEKADKLLHETGLCQELKKYGEPHPVSYTHLANLLPVTKFVGNGLLIKCLGQVDLPGAPLDIACLLYTSPDEHGLQPGYRNGYYS